MAETWQGYVNQASAKYSKELTDLTIRTRFMLAMLERRSRINLGVDWSFEEKYPVDWKDAPVTSLGHGGGATYAPRDYTKLATQDLRGFLATDMMHIKEQEMLGNSSARFVDRYKRIVPKLTKSMRQTIGLKFYGNGNAAGAQDEFSGMETMMASSTEGTHSGSGTNVVADLIAEADGTYNSLVTDLATAGDWSTDLAVSPNANVATDWPEGTGDPEYDYWTPKLINWASTSWPSESANSWADTSAFVLRRTAQWLRQTAGMEGETLVALLSGHMMTEFKDAQEAKLRTLAQHPEARDLGFPGVLEYDGIALKSEYGIPTDTGYVLNLDEVELGITGKMFITTKGPFLDPDSLAYKWFVYTFGNFKFVPKFCAKLYPYASA